MTEIIKFHEKNKALFANIQAAEGTYDASVATDALAVMSIDGSITTETGSYEYLGNVLSRDEYSYTQDQYADFTCETPQQILGTLNGSLAVADVPLSSWFQASGGYVTVLSAAVGSFAAGTVFIDNSRVSDELLSIDYRKSTPQDTVNEKLTKFYDCRGTIDVNVTLGDLPKIKFGMKGNADDPIQAEILTPNFGSQFEDVVASIKNTTIVTAEIAERSGTYTAFGGTIDTITRAGNIATATTAAAHSLGSNGSIRFMVISGATDDLYNGTVMVTITSATTFIYVMSDTPSADASGTFAATVGPEAKNFCFSTLDAPNFFGFEYNRYKTGCETGFSKKAVPSDVTVSVLENVASAVTITDITSTTTTATVTAASHGLTTGDSVTISEVTGTEADYYNGTFDVTVTDVDTFTITITSYTGSYTDPCRMVNNDFAYFDPDRGISEFFGAQIKFGTEAGKYCTYKWDKLQIKDVKEGTVDSYLGRDVSFRNTGRSWLILE